MKIIIILLIVIVILLLIWIIGSYGVIRNIETPKYKVISKEKDYEIREYEPYIVAQVEVSGERKQAMNAGFRLLAGYIFGGNIQSNSISMTAPVIEQPKSEAIKMTVPVIESQNDTGSRIVQFTMPSKYTLETLPKPNNSKVHFQTVSSKQVAVLRYTGYTSEQKVENKKNELLEILQRDKKETIGEIYSASYNPPLSFPFMRRNEVMIEIK